MLRLQNLLTLRKTFMVIGAVLVLAPLAVAWAWPHAGGAFAIGLAVFTTVVLRLGLVVVQPLRDMLAVVRRMEAGDANARIRVSGAFVPSEIRALQEAFNALAERNDEAQRREREARLAAESESKAKTDFLRFVTHELRSPANAVIGFAELIASERHGPLGAPSYREHVRDILAGSRHLLSLINDLLDLSKIEAGKYPLTLEPIGVDELIERCRRYLQPLLIENGISMSSRYDGAIPALVVDERAMFQAILNLASNAARYGIVNGSVEISARLLADGSAEILVVDDGPGIAPADLPRVMEPFQRAESSKSRHIQGTGLGLPIVKRLVELHGGTFELSSELGRGTRACIRLPGRCVAPDLIADQPQASGVAPASPVPIAA